MIVCKEISFEDDLPWDDLVEKSTTATFFQTKEWLSIWLKHFGGRELIYSVYDDLELVGIAPFNTFKGQTFKGVGLMGVEPVLGGELVSDFGDIISKERRAKEVWETVLSRFSPGRSRFATPSRWPACPERSRRGFLEGEYRIEFNFIREDSPSFKVLRKLAGEVEVVDVAPYLDLPKTWEEYLLSLDRHNRHELKRKMRKAENEDVQIVLSSGSIEDINELFRLMELSSKEKQRFLSEKMKVFFQDIIITFYKKEKAELMFMRKDNINIAATLSFHHSDEVLLYNSGFDPQFGYLSAGLLLTADLIKQAIKGNLKRFDFLRGNERYKYDLGGKKRNLYKISFQI